MFRQASAKACRGLGESALSKDCSLRYGPGSDKPHQLTKPKIGNRTDAMPKSKDPYLDDVMLRYFTSMARRNLPRLAGADLEDLIQEGYLSYLICRTRYVGQRPKRRADGTYRRSLPPKRPDQTARRHFMGLVKRTMNNRIGTIARRQSSYVEQSVWSFQVAPEQTEASIWDAIIPAQQEQITISCMLRRMPVELSRLVSLLCSDLQEPYRRVKLGRWTLRETSDSYYSRLLGLPEDTPLSGMLEKYFLSSDPQPV